MLVKLQKVPWMILGIRLLGDNLKWMPKPIELGPRSEPKKLWHLLKFDEHEFHLTSLGPRMILGIRSLGDNLKWTTKTIELGPRSKSKKLRHLLKFDKHEVHLTS